MKSVVKIAIIFALFLILGCKKDKSDPVPPVINFLQANFSADKTYVVVKFEFFDGDGDLGLKQNENSGDYEFNLFVDYYEKENGIWKLKSPVITWNSSENKYDTTQLHLRVPFIENETNESLRGETEVNLFYNTFNIPDTFKYEIVLRDRALHSSNKITTSDLLPK
ncbi:MAG: hypothetical protein J5I47_02270 [Vicingus serpentipes]|nr:hypothetical protein [Vicingus serpentipes]